MIDNPGDAAAEASERHQVYITDGNWRVVRYEYDAFKTRYYTYIEHNCSYTSNDRIEPEGYYKGGWHGHIYGVKTRGAPCVYCHEAPSEGLQMSFWFLKLENRGKEPV